MNRITFEQNDIIQMKDFNPHSHFYSFNPTWPQELIEQVVQIINNTNSFKVLVWNKKPSECSSLKNVQFIDKISCKSVAGESFTFYFYKKVALNQNFNDYWQ